MDIGGYYEALIQVRPDDGIVVDYIIDQVDKQKNVSVVKIVSIRKGSGVDIYLTSWRYAVTLGRKLKRVFKGDLNITRSVYGRSRERSKAVYRVTVLFRVKHAC